MRTGSLRGSPLARLVPAHHAGHAGPCSVVGVARTRRKKLQTRRCGSASPNCATCSAHCYGAGGTALSTCCIGPTGDDNINSTQCAVTTGNADRPYLHSIYNCSTKVGIRAVHPIGSCLDSRRAPCGANQMSPQQNAQPKPGVAVASNFETLKLLKP